MTASAAPRSSPPQLLVETLALDRIVGAPERDRPLPDALDEREQLGSGLLGDDLAEQRPEQPDLDRERVARAGRADPERLGGDGRRDGAPSATPSRGPSERDRSASEPPPDRNLPGRNLSVGLYGDARDERRIRVHACPRRRVGGAPRAAAPDADDQLEQLRFLHEVARLATTARTWDELLETVVDRTRDVLHADVSSLYLLDRDGAYLTLAATNGLDRFQIGRARVPFGEGVTGRVAADRRPLVIPDVKADARFLWVRGIDQRRFVASMLSVPLTWHDQIVGVLNVQTEQTRTFSDHDVAQLGAVADLLAGIIEKGRQQIGGRGAGRGAQGDRRGAQRADRARHPRAADAARDRPRLCRPARRRAAPARPRIARPRAPRDARGVAPGDARADRAARPPRRLDPRLGPRRAGGSGDGHAGRSRRRSSARSSPRSSRSSSTTRVEVVPSVRLQPLADPPRLRQILEHLVENAVKYAPPDTDHPDRLVAQRGRRPARRLGRGPGHPRRVARADLRAVRPARHAHGARLGDRAVRRQAPRRIDGRPPVVRAGQAPRRPVRRRPPGRRRHLNTLERGP